MNHVKNGITFIPVPKFNGFMGASVDEYFDRTNLPDVPKEYEKMASDLFFSGGQLPKFIDGIDKKDAFHALNGWLRSWDASHESKMATIAYALWVWCEGPDKVR